MIKRSLWPAVLIVAAFSSTTTSARGLSEYASPKPSHREEIKRLIAAWNSHDPDKVAAAFTEDGVYDDVAAGHISRGRVEVRKWAEGGFEAFQNFRMEIVSSSYHNGRGTMEWIWRATDKATGKSFSVRGVTLFEVRKGKISLCREYYDAAAIMRQTGQLPPEKD